MKKRNSHILVVLFTMLLPCAAWADLKVDDTFETDGITYHVTSTNPLEVSVGNGVGTAIDKETTGAIVIPDDVTGPDNKKYSVTNIAPSSFSGCMGLTAVTIGNSIKKIQYKAFYDCSNLTTFNIPASVTDIGLHAFEKTAWYTNLSDGLIYKDNVLFGYKGKKPEGDLKIVDGTRVIAYSAIFDCDITSVSIPNSVMFIGQQAFQGCYLLKSVTIPNSVKSIGFRAFAESGLTEIHSLMKEPCKLEDEAFRYQYIDAETYYSRVTLYVPAGTKALYEAADGWKEFKNIVEKDSESGVLKVNDAFTVDGISYFVKSLQPMEVAVGVYHTSETIITAVPQDTTGDIVIPSTVTAPDGNLYTVTSVGYQAFRGCANIISVSLPESITEISPQSFTMCVKLSTINIPNSVNSIGYNAFMNCNGLQSVTLPNSITSIGFGAFGWCPNLLKVYSYIEEPFAISSGGMGTAYNPFDYNREGLTLYVPAGTKAKYEATEGWKEFKNIVEMESGAKELAVGDTFEADGITYKVTGISPMEVMVGNGEGVAIDKETQGELIIPESVTASDGNSYSVTSIGRGAFKYCLGLSAINIPNTVISIASSAFFQTGMTSLTLPASVTKIGLQAFEANMNITEIKVEVENAHYDSRDNCNAIIETATNKLIVGCKNSTIPNSVQNIGEGAFYGLWGLKSISIPNSVKSIGDRAFQNCELKEIHSYIEEPFKISPTGFDAVFDSQDWSILYVPTGTKTKYEATDGWKEFKNIVEMVNLEPIEGETTVNTESLSGQDLSDNVVADVYYNTGDNSYDATDGSIIISEATNMGQITNAEPGSADVKDKFTGIILKVAKGKGVITVNVKTSGNAQLVVQVGNGTPMIASKTEKGDVVVSYDVEEDTYVYIYAILGGSTARATRASSDGEVRIYGISVRPGATGISSIVKEVNADAPIYNLSGQRLSVPSKGVNIIDGKKVVIK